MENEKIGQEFIDKLKKLINDENTEKVVQKEAEGLHFGAIEPMKDLEVVEFSKSGAAAKPKTLFRMCNIKQKTK